MGQNNNFDANQRIKSLQDTADFHTVMFASKGFLGRTIRDDDAVPSVGIRAAIRAGAIPDANGKLRCPPGTPNANQFTDIQLSNCGTPSVRTATNAVAQLASQLGNNDSRLQEDIAGAAAVLEKIGAETDPELMAKAVSSVQQMDLEERQVASLVLGGKKKLDRENRRIRNTKDFTSDLSKTPRERMSERVISLASRGKSFFRSSALDSSDRNALTNDELIAERNIRAIGDDILDASSQRIAIAQEYISLKYGVADTEDKILSAREKLIANKIKGTDQLTARIPSFERQKNLKFIGRADEDPNIYQSQLSFLIPSDDPLDTEPVLYRFVVNINMDETSLPDNTGDLPLLDFQFASDGSTHPPEELLSAVNDFVQHTIRNNTEYRQTLMENEDGRAKLEQAEKEFQQAKRDILVQALRDSGVQMGPSSPEQAESLIEIIEKGKIFKRIEQVSLFGRNLEFTPKPLDPDSDKFKARLDSIRPVLDTIPQYFWDDLEKKGIKIAINIEDGTGERRSDCKYSVNKEGIGVIEITMRPRMDETVENGSWDSFNDVFGHELFHGFQTVEPREDELSYRHLASRTSLRVDPQSRPKQLSSLIPGSGYSEEETAYEDDWDNIYQGKVYDGEYSAQKFTPELIATIEGNEGPDATNLVDPVALYKATSSSPRGMMAKELGAVSHQHAFGAEESGGDLDSVRHFLGSLVALSRVAPGIEAQEENKFVDPRPTVEAASPQEALEIIDKNQVAKLDSPQEAHTLLTELSKMAKEAKSSGGKAPDYDLCQVSVPGTNLFCGESKGIPRKKMPQFSGSPEPGSPADSMPKNSKGEVDGTMAFVDHMNNLGVDVQERTVLASSLKASQNELVGEKVAGMMDNPAFDPAGEAIFISRDGYVIDGHHRWAAQVGRDLEDGTIGDLPLNVRMVDMDIQEVLEEANKFAKEFGIAPKVAGGPK